MGADDTGIYTIRNTLDGKVYVGSAVNIRHRWNVHRGSLRKGDHHALRLQRAWNKHGEAAFQFEIVELVNDRSQLLTREQFWIDATGCTDPLRGYNVCPIAGSRANTEWTPEQLERARLHGLRSGISQKCRDAQRANMLDGLAREMQAKTVAARKANGSYQHSEETRKSISEKQRGHTESAETRKKRSDAMKAVCADADYRALMSFRGKGRTVSPETRALISAAQKGRPGRKKTEEEKERIRATLRAQRPDPATRQAMSERMKRVWGDRAQADALLEGEDGEADTGGTGLA